MDTYLKSLTFSASNGKCYNSLSSFRIFQCTLRGWVIKRTQKLHENIGDIFGKVWIVCVECNKLDSLLDHRLERIRIDSWVVTIDNLYVCMKNILPKLHSNAPLSYPFSRTSNSMNDSETSVTSATCLSLPWISSCWITLRGWSTFLYVLQELIKLLHGFVNHIRSSVRKHLGTGYSAMVRSPLSCLRKGGDVIILTLNLMIMSILGRLYGFKVITRTFLHFASIQSAYSSNSQDLVQKFDLTTHKIPL